MSWFIAILRIQRSLLIDIGLLVTKAGTLMQISGAGFYSAVVLSGSAFEASTSKHIVKAKSCSCGRQPIPVDSGGKSIV